MGRERTQWRGVFRIERADTGEVVCEENEILADGIEMTLALWAGDTQEAFNALRLEDSGGATIAENSADIDYTVDETGSAPRGQLESRALFSASAVTSAVHAVSIIGTLNTVIARATLSTPLDADQAYNIKRFDYLAESADVEP
jgi:hypothetical protein